MTLVEMRLVCPGCQTEAAAKLPAGITGLKCAGCSARFLVLRDPPKEKSKGGRKRASHRAPPTQLHNVRLSNDAYRRFQQTERAAVLAEAGRPLNSNEVMTAIAARWQMQKAEREAAGEADEDEDKGEGEGGEGEDEDEHEDEDETSAVVCDRGHEMVYLRVISRDIAIDNDHGTLKCDRCIVDDPFTIKPGDWCYTCRHEACVDEGGFDVCQVCADGGKRDAVDGAQEEADEEEEAAAAAEAMMELEAERDHEAVNVEMLPVPPPEAPRRGRVRKDTGMAGSSGADAPDSAEKAKEARQGRKRLGPRRLAEL
jgi:hypothetical protein